MRESRTQFKLLNLPIIVIQKVLSSMTGDELFDFSLCSKRFTGINLEISKAGQLVSVEGRNGFDWVISKEIWTSGYSYMKINGKQMKMMMSSGIWREMSTNTPEIDIRILVDHLKEIFRIPTQHVFFKADGISNFMDYIPLFSQCQSMFMIARSVSKEALESFKAQITVADGFFINYNEINPKFFVEE
uniref:F-box domain-containing protein n=1 Tax=Caenorhabditis tropicalis TaxID=1561998 RepID=A0A1I7TBH0_9PELO